MSIILPLIFRKAQKTVDEELEQLQKDQLQFGIHYQGLGKLHGGKGWLDYYKTDEHCSYSSIATVMGGSLSVNSHDTESWKACEELFREYSGCLEAQALRHNFDPLAAISMKQTPGAPKYCYILQDSMFKVCGGAQAQDFCDGRRRELYWARLRRRYILATRDLKRDLGFRPYPDWLFSTEEQTAIYGTSFTDSIREKIKAGNYSEIFSGTSQQKNQQRRESFTEIAELKDEMWPESSMSGSQLGYVQFVEGRRQQRSAESATGLKDTKNPTDVNLVENAGPRQSPFTKYWIGTTPKTLDISYLSVDPTFREYLASNPTISPQMKKNEAALRMKVF